VALPPGRDRLLARHAPTGSGTITNTIGTVRVACSSSAAPIESRIAASSGDRGCAAEKSRMMIKSQIFKFRETARTPAGNRPADAVAFLLHLLRIGPPKIKFLR
jgi:hypothetical protein